MSTGPSLPTRKAVYDRTGRRCGVCGQPANQIHHRRPRAMGGTRNAMINDPANLLAVCSGCHEWIETHRTLAREAGLLVSHWQDPAEVPITTWGGRVWLRSDGTVSTEPP